jgi:hypothetical protein
LDLQNLRCTVRAKGKKDRTLCFGIKTRKALWAHLKEETP